MMKISERDNSPDFIFDFAIDRICRDSLAFASAALR
jgi:hypothetical protein